MPLSKHLIRLRKPSLDNPVISAQPRGFNEVLIRRSSILNATSYEVRIGTIPGLWQPAGIFDSEAEIAIHGLVPGLDYYISVRALGEDASSAWSDQISYRSA